MNSAPALSRRFYYFVLFALAMSGVSKLSAVVLFSDDFSANGGGTGWASSSSWSGPAAFDDGKISHNGASFRLLADSIDVDTMDFWLGMEISLAGNTSYWGGVSFYDNGDEDLFIGTDGASLHWEFSNASVFNDKETSVLSYNQGSLAYLVLHITSESVDMWVNPADSSSLSSLGAADAAYASGSIDPSSTWNQIGIRSDSSVTITMDSILATTTLGELSSVPEPSAYALIVGLGMVGFVSFRRGARQRERKTNEVERKI